LRSFWLSFIFEFAEFFYPFSCSFDAFLILFGVVFAFCHELFSIFEPFGDECLALKRIF